MDEQERTTAEQFRTWLETSTNLSPITMKNYYFIVKKLLAQFPKPSLEDINSFLAQFTRGKTNGIMGQSAAQKYLEWQGRTLEMKRVLRGKDVGRKHLESDITLDKVRLLMPHFIGVHKDVFMIQYYTGCREIEALLLERENVRFDTEYCEMLVTKKGGRSHTIRLPLAPATAIFGKPEYQTRKYVFLKERCQDLSRYEILRDHYNAIVMAYLGAWHRACKAAGLDVSYASHDARRALIRAVSEKHGLMTAKKLAGHVRAETTMTYLPQDGIDTLKAVRDVMKE